MHKRYPDEFRRDVIAVARQGGQTRAQIARSFGISESCLGRWLRIADHEDSLTAPTSPDEPAAESDVELRELQLEVGSTPADMKRPLREFAVRNLGRAELVRLYVVLGAEAVEPSHPAHQYFADREVRIYDSFELALSWKSDGALAARELMSFWTGLERQWVMNPSVDFLAVWDHFADRFFVME